MTSKRNFPESSMERWRCLHLRSLSHFCLRSVITFIFQSHMKVALFPLIEVCVWFTREKKIEKELLKTKEDREELEQQLKEAIHQKLLLSEQLDDWQVISTTVSKLHLCALLVGAGWAPTRREQKRICFNYDLIVFSTLSNQVIWWGNLEDWGEKLKSVSHNLARP